MTRRLPAAPPGREAPPGPPDPDDRPRPMDDLDGIEEADPLDEDLLDPDAFPDDPEDPVLTEALERDAPPDLDLDVLPSLDVDEPEDEVDVLIEDQPLDDDLVDLEAPDDDEMPVLSWSTTVHIDGRPLPAVVDPGRQRTVWLTAACEAPTATVALQLAGRTLRLQIECSAEGGGPERVVLGRDVLAGRFLLRP
jgi:hypothetical protein